MRILQICHQYSYPPNRGGKIDSFNFTRQYALLGHSVSVVAMVHDEETPDVGLRQYCEKLYTYRIDRRNRITRAARNLFSHFPYNVSKYHSRGFLALVDKVYRKDQIDVVHVDHLHAAIYGAYLSERYDVPIVLRQQNVETEIMRRYAHDEQNPLKRTFALLQCAKLRSYEPKMCSLYDFCACVTERDVDLLRSWNAAIDARYVPAGVDVDKYSYHGSSGRDRGVILSLGSLDWLPNQAGLEWFVKRVLSRIRENVSDAELRIVGSGRSGNNLLAVCESSPGVKILGYVDDDAAILRSASVMIVPLFVGGGLRLKILNAFASGIPVVTTSVGGQGISLVDGRECYISDDPIGFAAHVTSVLKNPQSTDHMTQSARKLIEGNHDWRSIVSRQASMLEEILAAKSV